MDTDGISIDDEIASGGAETHDTILLLKPAEQQADEDGNVLKRVTSGDSGEIEDNENGGENQNGGSTSGTDIPPVINP